MLETFIAVMLFLGILAFKFLYIVAILVAVGLTFDWIQAHQHHPEVA